MDKITGNYKDMKVLLNDPEITPQIRIFNARGGISGLSFNPNLAPTTDIRVRRALHLALDRALDRDEMLDLAMDGPRGGYIGGYWQPWFWPEERLRALPGWRKEKDQDLAEAVKLLDQFQQRLYDLRYFAPTVRFTYYHFAYKYVRGWRNEAYDVGNSNASDLANVWLDK